MRRFFANLSNIFPLGGTGYVRDIPLSERIPPKSLGSAVPDPHALANTLLRSYQYPSPSQLVTVKAHPGVNVGEPAPSLAMDATIDGHRYKGVLYLAEGEKDDPKGE